ncbi:hypothetical protein ACCW92_11135 [Enterobacter soli]|uniref:hypothetical protein n=1 Tax=Enterobacter soli TaxID=885040 RepID=UPI003EDB0C76
MTVINKVNDDSESYFSDFAGFCFVIQCCNIFMCKLLILYGEIFGLIISAIFLSSSCFVKVPVNLQNETSCVKNETSSKFSYHIPVGLFCNFKENEIADWLRGLISKQW